MHCRPSLWHSHARADGPAVDQVEFWVQLQHRSTVLQTCLLDGLLTVEHIPSPSIGVSPFLFCPPDDLTAVTYPDMPPSIAWPSLL